MVSAFTLSHGTSVCYKIPDQPGKTNSLMKWWSVLWGIQIFSCFILLYIFFSSFPSSPLFFYPLLWPPKLPIYAGDLVFFSFLYRSVYVSLRVLFLGLLSRFFGVVDCRLVFILCLKVTYEWVHIICVFLGLGYLIQYVFFLDPSIFLQISRRHFFLTLSSNALCKCNTLSLSTLQLRLFTGSGYYK